MSEHFGKYTKRIGTTLDRFIQLRQKEFSYATGELSQLLRDIGLAAKILNREISRSGLIDIEGSVGVENVQGEEQKMLDVMANERFIRALQVGGQTCCIISEENDSLIETDSARAKYIVAIDPIDGSSNVDVNIPIGTAFSILRRRSSEEDRPRESDTLQPGTAQVVAGYILYGSSTMLVYTTGYGVNGFTYDPTLGEFYLSHPGMTIPDEGKTYSVNESNYFHFSEGMQHYLDHCKRSGYTSRYIGSLVADFHRNLLQGGIYLYPPTKERPGGKLRLLYECNPLAFIAEQAGGMATDGRERILEVTPQSLHQRSPLIIGNKKMVEEAMEFLNPE